MLADVALRDMFHETLWTSAPLLHVPPRCVSTSGEFRFDPWPPASIQQHSFDVLSGRKFRNCEPLKTIFYRQLQAKMDENS
jgi:hypothetical protein